MLNTSFQTLRTRQGRTVSFTNGVFVFRNVRIRSGVTVRGVGPNPLIWLVTGDLIVEGDLDASGGKGADVDTLNSANFPAPGGAGGPAAGRGGDGSPQTIARSLRGAAGFGPLQIPGLGGRGGLLAVGRTTGHYGSGGGGGTFATAGDRWWSTGALPQEKGIGGPGRDSAGPVPGGLPGPSIFGDGIPDNDFWGVGVDVFRRRVIAGELPFPIGGQGGGGGGSGGTLALFAHGSVDIGVQGETWANGDSRFPISADGGIGTNSGFGRPPRTAKYPVQNGSVNSGSFGGLGIVQITTRPGTNADATNTVLDDNVRLFRGATELRGAEKARYLAWRGWPNAQGVLVDDFGRPTNIGREGDIKPSPILLPLF